MMFHRQPPRSSLRRLKPEYTLVLECFFDDSGKESDNSHRFVTCAGYMTFEESWYQFVRGWQHLLLKHELPYVHMKEWIKLASDRCWDAQKRHAVLGEFVKLIRDCDLIGVGVAVDADVWRAMPKDRRKRFGDAQVFCVSRLVRHVIDRMDGANTPERVGIYFDRDFEFGSRRLNLMKAVFGMDPRVPQRIALVAFGDAEFYPQLQAADIIAWATRRELVQRLGGKSLGRLWDQLFDEIPYQNAEHWGEYWDQSHVDKYFPEIEAALAKK